MLFQNKFISLVIVVLGVISIAAIAGASGSGSSAKATSSATSSSSAKSGSGTASASSSSSSSATASSGPGKTCGCPPSPPPPPKCKKNEFFAACGVDACNNKPCDKKDEEIACITLCQPQNAGCACRSGFCRDQFYECVPREQCLQECGVNEFFAACGVDACNNTPCDKKDEEIACIDLCQPQNAGCACRSGYFRIQSGECVLPGQCPPICDKNNNEELAICGPKPCNSVTCAQTEYADF